MMFSELQTLEHILDGNKAVVPGKHKVPEKVSSPNSGRPPISKWWERKPNKSEILHVPNPSLLESDDRVFCIPDHWSGIPEVKLLEGEYGMRVREVLHQYPGVIFGRVGQTRMLEYQIRL